MTDADPHTDPRKAPYDVPLRVTLLSGHVTTATRRKTVGWQGNVAPIPEEGIVRWEVIEE